MFFFFFLVELDDPNVSDPPTCQLRPIPILRPDVSGSAKFIPLEGKVVIWNNEVILKISGVENLSTDPKRCNLKGGPYSTQV